MFTKESKSLIKNDKSKESKKGLKKKKQNLNEQKFLSRSGKIFSPIDLTSDKSS